MIESAKKHIDILESLDFHDYCISLKSSDTMLTIEAYTLASETFDWNRIGNNVHYRVKNGFDLSLDRSPSNLLHLALMLVFPYCF